MTTLQMYLLLKLDTLKSFVDFFGWFGGICLVVLTIFYMVLKTYVIVDSNKDREDYEESITVMNMVKPFLKLWYLCAFLIILSISVPTTKQMAAIIIVPKVVNNEQVQEIPNKILDLATEWLEELKPIIEKQEAK